MVRVGGIVGILSPQPVELSYNTRCMSRLYMNRRYVHHHEPISIFKREKGRGELLVIFVSLFVPLSNLVASNLFLFTITYNFC